MIPGLPDMTKPDEQEFRRFIARLADQQVQQSKPQIPNQQHNRVTRVFRHTLVNPFTALNGGGQGFPSYDTVMGTDELGAWRPDLPTVLNVPRTGWYFAGGGVWANPISNWSAVQVAFHILGTVPGAVQDIIATNTYPSVVANVYVMTATVGAPTFLQGGTTISSLVQGPAGGTWALSGRSNGAGYATTLWLMETTNPLIYEEALA